MYFDTHAHLDDKKFDKDRDAVISDMKNHGVTLIVNVGCDLTSSFTSVRLAEKYDFIYAAVGCHPHDAKKMTDGDTAIYEGLTKREKVKAIGEIGLDYHYDHSPRDVQRQRFREQLDLAANLHMPVVIHEREAHEDCMKIVREFASRVTGVFHCYSGGVEMAKEIVKLGWYLSFTGAITFPNARRAIEVIEWAPMDRLFIETDSPYLTPVPHRGERNDSRFVPFVAGKIAAIKGMEQEEVAAVTMENGKRFFGI